VDALAVGLSFSVLEVSIWYPSVMIGIIMAAMSFPGLVTTWATLGWVQACVIGIIGAFGLCTGCEKITPITQA